MLAYLILVHRSPAQLARLVAALDDPRVEFFVHVDGKFDDSQFRYVLRRRTNVRFVGPRQPITWGGWGMVEAELCLVRAALDAGARHLVLLSGADFPRWSNDRLVKHFLAGDACYLEHLPIPSPCWHDQARNRIEQYWLADDPMRFAGRLFDRTLGRLWRPLWHRGIRYGANLALKLGYELGFRRRMPGDLTPYIGSQWWSLDRECAEYLIEFVARRPEVVRFYRHTHVPDESFVHTVLANSPYRSRLVDDALRYVVWDGGSSPRVLEAADLPSIERSDAAFVRKIACKGETDLAKRLLDSEPVVHRLEALRTEPAHEESGDDGR